MAQNSFRFAGHTNHAPKKISRSIVKAARQSSSQSQEPPVSESSTLNPTPTTNSTGYVNPLFQDLTIDGVELGFSSIQRLTLNEQVATKNQPKDHAHSVFANQDKISYFAADVNAPKFPQQVRTASTFQHQPLYFEEMNLERHGKSLRSLQPIVSGIRFYGTVPLLPYKMAVQPPRSHTNSHDPYPAGVPAPWVRESKPLSAKGVTFEVAMIAAAIMIIP